MWGDEIGLWPVCGEQSLMNYFRTVSLLGGSEDVIVAWDRLQDWSIASRAQRDTWLAFRRPFFNHVWNLIDHIATVPAS